MQKNIVVFIYLANEPVAVPAGVFTYDESERIGEFRYGNRYSDRTNALPVDPVALPMGISALPTNLNEGIYGTFRDSMPDYWGRIVMAAKQGIMPEHLSVTEIMLESNAARVGNLDFRLSPESPEPALDLPNFFHLADLQNAAWRIENNERVSKQILDLYAQGTSMGGARPKCTVQHDKEMWLAKFPSKNDTADIPLIEYATMRLASECGINIPEVRLERIGQQNIFMIKRFDRLHTEQGWLRHGFMSALSLMQWDERDRHLWSYPSLADEMRKYMPVDNLHQLYKRMVFNALINNTDDHPRNHGFLTYKRKLALSPAYDIVPAIKKHGIGSESSLEMAIGSDGRIINIDNLLSQYYMFGYAKREQAVEECIKPLKKIVSHWKEYFDSYGVNAENIRALEETIYVPAV